MPVIRRARLRSELHVGLRNLRRALPAVSARSPTPTTLVGLAMTLCRLKRRPRAQDMDSMLFSGTPMRRNFDSGFPDGVGTTPGQLTSRFPEPRMPIGLCPRFNSITTSRPALSTTCRSEGASSLATIGMAQSMPCWGMGNRCDRKNHFRIPAVPDCEQQRFRSELRQQRQSSGSDLQWATDNPTINHFFDTSCFSDPAPGKLGQREPHSALRSRIREYRFLRDQALPLAAGRHDLEFRAEFFNLFNHAQFFTAWARSWIRPTSGRSPRRSTIHA